MQIKMVGHDLILVSRFLELVDFENRNVHWLLGKFTSYMSSNVSCG